MSASTRVNEEWIPVQIKVFSRWVSNHLIEGHSTTVVKNITSDLSNGVALVELAEILTGKKAPRNWIREPKMAINMVQNCDLAIEMFTNDGVQFVGISGKDVNDNKEKLILWLVWTLILHYSISKSVDSTTTTTNSKDSRMQWAIERTSKYPHVDKFTPYDLSMCALLDSYVPEKINYNSLDPKDTETNSELAAKVMQELGIHVYLDPEDVHGKTKVDEKALLTQLSTMKVSLQKYEEVHIKQTKLTESSGVFNQSTETNESIIDDAIESGNVKQDGINEESSSDSEEEIKARNIKHPEFTPHKIEGNNSKYPRKFGLIMTLNESDYNEGRKIDMNEVINFFSVKIFRSL